MNKILSFLSLNAKESTLRQITNILFGTFTFILGMHEAGIFQGKTTETIILAGISLLFYLLYQDKNEVQLEEIQDKVAILFTAINPIIEKARSVEENANPDREGDNNN